MNAAHTKKLLEEFPDLFKELQWGFAVGDGWFALVYNLAADIVKLDPSVRAVQIKEKFGGLRFYVGGALKSVFGRIQEAEDESYRVCEDCGRPGKPNGGGWIATLCDDCRAARAHREVLRLRSLRKKVWKEGTA